MYHPTYHMDSTPTLLKYLLQRARNWSHQHHHTPIQTPSYELRLGFIAMVREQSFSGLEEENPYTHLFEFEQLCSFLTIAGMAQQTSRWKLFPFSLSRRAKQWYSLSVRSVEGSWEMLREKLCLTFFPIPKVASLRCEILSFEQREKQSLGAA